MTLRRSLEQNHSNFVEVYLTLIPATIVLGTFLTEYQVLKKAIKNNRRP